MTTHLVQLSFYLAHLLGQILKKIGEFEILNNDEIENKWTHFGVI